MNNRSFSIEMSSAMALQSVARTAGIQAGLRPSPLRILIATVTAGGGHIAAAAALEEAWRALRPDDTVERLDLIKFFSPLHKKIHADGYVQLVERAPELWGMLFGKTDNPKVARRLSKLRRAFPSNSRKKFARHLKQFKPDAVLCTHYLPLETLGLLKSSEGGVPRRPKFNSKSCGTRITRPSENWKHPSRRQHRDGF